MRGLVDRFRALSDHSGTFPRRPSGDGSRTRTLPQDGALLRFRLAAVLAAQLFDFVTFTIMVERHGIQAELNPIAAATFHSGGLPVLLFVKLMLIVLVGSVIVILGRRDTPFSVPSRLAGLIAVAAVAGGLFGGFSNAITI